MQTVELGHSPLQVVRVEVLGVSEDDWQDPGPTL